LIGIPISQVVKASTSSSIFGGGWKDTGLQPLSPMGVPSKLSETLGQTLGIPHTPARAPDHDTALPCSNRLDGTKLRRAETALRSELVRLDEPSSAIHRTDNPCAGDGPERDYDTSQATCSSKSSYYIATGIIGKASGSH
jgi:hypothetical protein